MVADYLQTHFKDQNLKLKIVPFSPPLPQILLDLEIFNYIESVFSCVTTNNRVSHCNVICSGKVTT